MITGFREKSTQVFNAFLQNENKEVQMRGRIRWEMTHLKRVQEIFPLRCRIHPPTAPPIPPPIARIK